jgi:uncharacterized protein YbaP (TraB family)
MIQTNIYPIPGYLYQITCKNNSVKSIVKEAMGIKEKEQELYIYFTSSSSTVNPFNNTRLKSIMNDVDVIVFDTLPEKQEEDQWVKILQNNYDQQTLARINNALTQSLKCHNKDMSKVDQKIGNDPKKLALGIQLKALMLFAKNSGAKIEEAFSGGSQSRTLPPSNAKQHFHEKAEEAKKVIEYMDQKKFVDRHKELLFDKGCLEFILCSVITDKELIKEFMATSKMMDEAWNTGALTEVDNKKLINHPAIVKLQQNCNASLIGLEFDQALQIAKKANQCFESNKKALFVLEQHPSSMKLLQAFIIMIGGNDIADINLKGPLKEPTGYFWKIKKDGKTVGYLLGSIHITPNHLLDLNSRIRKCFEKSARLAVEIDITREDADNIKEKKEKKKREIEQQSKLSNDQVENVCEVLKKVFPSESEKINFDDAQEKEQFIFLGSSLLKSRIFTKLSLHSGIDRQLISQAKKVGKPVEDLETLEQYKQLETATKALKTDSIKDGLLQILSQEDLKKEADVPEIINGIIEQFSLFLNEELKPMYEAWEEGNLEKMDHSKTDSAEKKMDMTLRNMNMANKIVKLVNKPQHDQEKLFCCIGAAHTAGRMNVQAFLSNLGLTTERVLI